MQNPTKASELQQLLCATNWMRSALPNYALVTAPLHELMKGSYAKEGGKRTKRAIRNISISNDWGAEHDISFTSIKYQIAAAVKLSHPSPDFDQCLFTDASDTHWSAILTQVPKEHLEKQIEDQDHQPLCFLSGAFKDPALTGAYQKIGIFYCRVNVQRRLLGDGARGVNLHRPRKLSSLL